MLQSKVMIPYLPRGWITTVHHHLIHCNVQVEVWGVWAPTIQRAEDRVLMDIVHKTVPSWSWGGINRCRLFLQATTVAGISAVDGKYIPLKIREVTNRLRENTLEFVFHHKPSKDDIIQWKFFLDSMANNRHLLCPT